MFLFDRCLLILNHDATLSAHARSEINDTIDLGNFRGVFGPPVSARSPALEMVLTTTVGPAFAATTMLPDYRPEFEQKKQPMLRTRRLPLTLHLLFKLR